MKRNETKRRKKRKKRKKKRKELLFPIRRFFGWPHTARRITSFRLLRLQRAGHEEAPLLLFIRRLNHGRNHESTGKEDRRFPRRVTAPSRPLLSPPAWPDFIRLEGKPTGRLEPASIVFLSSRETTFLGLRARELHRCRPCVPVFSFSSSSSRKARDSSSNYPNEPESFGLSNEPARSFKNELVDLLKRCERKRERGRMFQFSFSSRELSVRLEFFSPRETETLLDAGLLTVLFDRPFANFSSAKIFAILPS